MSVISSLAHYGDSDEEPETGETRAQSATLVAPSVATVEAVDSTTAPIDNFKPPTPYSFFSNPLKPPTPVGATVFKGPPSQPPYTISSVGPETEGAEFRDQDEIVLPVEPVAPQIVKSPISMDEFSIPVAVPETIVPDLDISPDDEERREHRDRVIVGDVADESEMEEPPPPPRPDTFGTPSPTADSRTGSPKIELGGTALPRMTVTASGVAINRMGSYSGLVSYAAEGEDEDDNAAEDGRVRGAPGSPRSGSASGASDDDAESTAVGGDQPGLDALDDKGLTMEVHSDDTADIDVDKYLEQALEAGLENNKEVRRVNGRLLKLPPKPKGECSKELQKKIDGFLAKKRAGTDPIAAIQNSKKFRNPSLYEKLINMLGIDEIGSNFEKKTFNPHGFNIADFYDELSKQQKIAMDKADKDKLLQKPTDASSGSHGNAKHDHPPNSSTSSSDKKKSKWDNPIPSAGVGRPVVAPAGPVSAPGSGPNPLVATAVGGIPVDTYPASQVGQAARVAAALQQQATSKLN